MRIGSWNMGVPDANSNLGAQQNATAEWMADNMKLLNMLDLDLLVFQEVSKHWAEQAQMQLQRGGVSWTLQHDDKKAILMKDTAVCGRASVGFGSGLVGWGLCLCATAGHRVLWVGRDMPGNHLLDHGVGRWGWVGG